MAFRRPRPPNLTAHRLSTDKELELEQINQELQEILQSEVAINKSNEKYIKDLERKYIRCENEIQSLKKELERLENVSGRNIDNIEKQLQELEERIQNLRHRFKGLNRLENHFRGGTPLINPIRIIEGIHGTLNTIRANYQRIDRDLDDIANQRDDRDNQIDQVKQITQERDNLQNQVNQIIQERHNLRNQVNRLTQERDNSQNDLTLMTTAYNNEQEERRRWWGVAQKLETGMQTRIDALLLDKFALNFKLRSRNNNDRVFLQFWYDRVVP
ncbi:1143_t:CDS:2, partial [Paraglomus occultum]